MKTWQLFPGAIAIIVGAVCLTTAGLHAQEASSDSATKVERGRELYLAYKCYACHGYSGQTGFRRLVPMQMPEAAFISFVQHAPLQPSRGPGIPTMPAYSEVPAADLADIHAYLLPIPQDSPPRSELPLLRDDG